MGIPEWNKLGTDTYIDNTDNTLAVLLDAYRGRTANINIRTTGTARYEERSDTSISVTDAIDYCFEYDMFDRWGIDRTQIGTGEILEMCNRYFQEDWEIGEVYDTEYWDHEIDNETIEEVTFV